MSRMRESVSIDLGRRAFGSAGGWGSSRVAPERSLEMIDIEEEIPSKPIAQPVSRMWKPCAGRIYNFPVPRVMEEK